ncbi:Uncharacterized protein OBRU01_09551 [Operophtera brumata]|uniref:Uncharacterized protein n=1 Tax=Operophtera brumata TaxID=104452 RepID=A0A0L7LG47_OPEBR|nr:Uncharacterized protein OBRU01_09551 [Operophtera brumata]
MVRISGICNIPETPVTIDKPTNTMTLANKENITNQQNEYKKLIATPKSTVRKQVLVSRIPDTPLYNESYNTSNDVSFLKNERDIENKTKALVLPEEYQQTLENIAEVPASTPFAEYRNANDFFSNSSNMIESSCNDNTIMCFDYIVSKDIDREESVIVSLCDLLNKATVSNTEKYSTELHDLLEMQKRIENNIQVIEKTMNNLKESELKSLEYVKKLIQEKKNHQSSESEKEKTAVATKESPKDEKLLNPEIIVGKPCSVIKTILKSPSYKTSKKCNSLRKKVSYKSMSNTSALLTPEKVMGVKAMSMYMKIKERHNYLNTPAVKREAPDTPAITSHNLRKQLDKLYDEN